MWDYAFIIPRRTPWCRCYHQTMPPPGIGPEGGEISRNFLFLAVCVTLEGCLDGIGRLRDILVRVSMGFQLFLSHIIYTFTYICVCIYAYCIHVSSVYIWLRLETYHAHENLIQKCSQWLGALCLHTLQHQQSRTKTRKGTDRCLSWSSVEVQVEVSE